MKNKRIISVVTIVVIVLSSIVVTGFAFAQNRPTVYSSFLGEVSAGDDITIPVSIRDNTGLTGFMLEFNYDSDIITPTSVDYGSVLSGGLQDNIEGDAKPGLFKVYWAGNENNSSNGVLFYINAHVNETAVGDATIVIDYSQSDTFDEDFNDIELTCEKIEFSVENNSYSQFAKITANDATVTAGDNIQLPLTISEINNISAVSLALTYNTDNFSFVSAQSTASLTSNDNNGTVAISGSGITASMNNTDFITLTFKAKDQADSGDYAFELTSTDEGIICKSCTVTINPSATSEVASISIQEGVAIEKGEVADIPVMISNNHGIMGYRLSFSYNPDEIKIVSVKKNTSIRGELYDSLGNEMSSFDVLWNNTSEVIGDTVLFYLEIENVSDSFINSTININYSQQDTFNEKYNDVVFDCKMGNITLCPGHSYIQNYKTPTCEEKGCTEYICEYCSFKYQENFTDELGHYYQYIGNQNGYITYFCDDCGDELIIDASEVLEMWESSYINTRPNSIDNRMTTDNSSLLNVVKDRNNEIINAKDYAALIKMQKSHQN